MKLNTTKGTHHGKVDGTEAAKVIAEHGGEE